MDRWRSLRAIVECNGLRAIAWGISRESAGGPFVQHFAISTARFCAFTFT
ncbi:hypothetical protein CLOSTASPAR_00582 [[Clostridium] asparagiforme DSM 15981]|uniref:Uncharacterized protein n=1 Tax=[Clostridium] asparagiforme DSM 15981 TaxID=518636 RepID=C0CUD3_9FIRM|nr:hypothetical protein CLOSTASPAR_00582 [[Clostridium] asparagiforme DSM 15981]